MAQIEVTSEELLAGARDRIEEITAGEALDRHADGDGVFVDVRTEAELDAVIPGAAHVPRALIEFEADPTSEYHDPVFDPGRSYVCYCTVGLRSAFVTDRLQRMGYDVVNLDGGIEAWRDAGGDVVSPGATAD
jgi:rhodanese-related sulfurtransferase